MSTTLNSTLGVVGTLSIANTVSVGSLTVLGGNPVQFLSSATIHANGSSLGGTLAAGATEFNGVTVTGTTTLSAGLTVGALTLRRGLAIGATTVSGLIDGNSTTANSVVLKSTLGVTGDLTVPTLTATTSKVTVSGATINGNVSVGQLWTSVAGAELIVKKGTSGTSFMKVAFVGGSTGRVWVNNDGLVYRD